MKHCKGYAPAGGEPAAEAAGINTLVVPHVDLDGWTFVLQSGIHEAVLATVCFSYNPSHQTIWHNPQPSGPHVVPYCPTFYFKKRFLLPTSPAYFR